MARAERAAREAIQPLLKSMADYKILKPVKFAVTYDGKIEALTDDDPVFEKMREQVSEIFKMVYESELKRHTYAL